MNKFGIVLGIAAVATLAGCKDPNYKHDTDTSSQNEVKSIDTTPVTTTDKAPVATDKPIVIEQPVVVTKKCTCLPGTRHTEPCTCGAPDCQCIVETRPVIPVDLNKAPKADEQYTVYVVQSGDYLAKISKRFNVTINSIRRLNPSIKNNVIYAGQKLKLPGKIDIPAAPVASKPTAAVKSGASAASVKKSSAATTYTGATKEYVVKSGDTLGSIAYGNGINIRQLKSLNGLTSDTLKVGQKLKIPAEKVVKAAAKVNAKAVEPKQALVKAETKAPVAAPVTESAPAEAAPVAAPVDGKASSAEAAPAPAPAAPVEAAPAKSAATTTYVVQEGDDMTAVSIRWGVSAAEIRELNNLADGDQLKPGQIIKLPAEAQQ